MTVMKTSLSERLRAVWECYGIPSRLKEARLSNYIAGSYEQEQAVLKCREFVADGINKIRGGQGLFFQGPVGTGKSHLAVATLYDVVEQNVELFGHEISNDIFSWDRPEYREMVCSFISVVDFLGLQKAGFSQERERDKANRLIRKCRNDSVVILDDLGAEKPSEWVEEQLYSVIDYRYRNMLSTFFTTNCSLQVLEERLGKRTVSRIFEMCSGVKVMGGGLEEAGD
jgi:DNA replication protein DnaC